MNRIRQRCTALVLLLLLVGEMGFAQALTPGATGCCGHCAGMESDATVAIVMCEEGGDALAIGDVRSTGAPPATAQHPHGTAPCTSCGLHCGMSMSPFVFFVAVSAVRSEAAPAVSAEGDVRLPASPPSRLERPPRFFSLAS